MPHPQLARLSPEQQSVLRRLAAAPRDLTLKGHDSGVAESLVARGYAARVATGPTGGVYVLTTRGGRLLEDRSPNG